MQTYLIFPHQLYEALDCQRAILTEDSLFFSQYHFHWQKLVLHRASMKAYQSRLQSKGIAVDYLENKKYPSLQTVFEFLQAHNIHQIHVFDPCDYLLRRRLNRFSRRFGIKLEITDSPGFLASHDSISKNLGDKKHYSLTSFYIAERKKRGILLEKNGSPEGGKWTFDTENRKKAPKNLTVPPPPRFGNSFTEEAMEYVRQHFPGFLGEALPCAYPTTHEEACSWLEFFITQKLRYFGDYEDAMLKNEPLLFHSALTPVLNIGLITPQNIIEAVLNEHNRSPIPLNSLEGFIRQIIGWREFMRGIYEIKGVYQRRKNYWGHHCAMPKCFYNGSTGILPVDHVIAKLLKTGYLHHIERLMVLGAFMMLCEIHPDEVYRWFMEFFVDSYDWVMVPNVYGMSQYADGGLITTKPYLCSSNYILKMSDYPKGEWCEVWDGLYWRFIAKHADFFASNPRLSMMAVTVRRMAPQTLRRHIENAERFLQKIRR